MTDQNKINEMVVPLTWRVNCQNRAARAAWAACMGKNHEIPRARASWGAMHWIRTDQVDSIFRNINFDFKSGVLALLVLVCTAVHGDSIVIRPSSKLLRIDNVAPRRPYELVKAVCKPLPAQSVLIQAYGPAAPRSHTAC